MTSQPERGAAAARAALRALQEALLASVLAGAPLPVNQPPARYPDMSWFEEQPEILLSDENIGGPFRLPESVKPVRILPQQEIRETARSRGRVSFFRFARAVAGDGYVELTLEGRSVDGQSSAVSDMGLSSIHVRFEESPQGWTATQVATLAS